MANILRNIHVVLFDLDGTLVDTDIDFTRMKNEMLALGARHGIDESELKDLDILAIVDHICDSLARYPGDIESAGVKEEAFRILEEIEVPACENARVVKCAPELLDALRHAGIKIGIVTRNCMNAVRCSLNRTSIQYDILLTRDDVLRTKPHPDHLIHALDMLGIPPCEALMVGDHWMDIMGGKAAGTGTIGFLRPDRPDDFFNRCPPDLIIRDLSELIDALKRL
ncbi:MAG: HAD family hydrolase [Armatimonadota bacterium]